MKLMLGNTTAAPALPSCAHHRIQLASSFSESRSCCRSKDGLELLPLLLLPPVPPGSSLYTAGAGNQGFLHDRQVLSEGRGTP